ncbi:hypothetical protein CYMTET_45075 [Cymbomonas tetramitiformis]|uniref:Uncharacterized protein n=1 Tax=Cymbomonas tetramitiformis TaxID=36881 RepID=A0AAE0C109_9CHLO|nr:hypothetical protein CYMTET_45075 [Cymbomonas tetramitiformis]
MGRHTASDTSREDRHGAREQQLVNEDVAVGTFRGGLSTDTPRGRYEGGHGGRAPLSGLHSRGILEVNLAQQSEHRPVINMALPTASEDICSNDTEVFQSGVQDQEVGCVTQVAAGAPTLPTERTVTQEEVTEPQGEDPACWGRWQGTRGPEDSARLQWTRGSGETRGNVGEQKKECSAAAFSDGHRRVSCGPARLLL